MKGGEAIDKPKDLSQELAEAKPGTLGYECFHGSRTRLSHDQQNECAILDASIKIDKCLKGTGPCEQSND